jgi:hypothetical protein
MKTLRNVVNVLTEILREIFDENAYARYLATESRTASAAAYADFVRDKYKAPAKRCC